MPRFIGKKSNTSAQLSLLILIAIGLVAGLEYAGAINLFDGVGKHRFETRTNSHYYLNRAVRMSLGS
jgi:hypothetical protein